MSFTNARTLGKMTAALGVDDADLALGAFVLESPGHGSVSVPIRDPIRQRAGFLKISGKRCEKTLAGGQSCLGQ